MNPNFLALIQEFGNYIGIADLAPENGHLLLSFDDILVDLGYREVDDSLVISAPLDSLPGDSPRSRFIALLAANFRQRLTGRGAIGIEFDAEANQYLVAISQSIPLKDCTQQVLQDLVETFLNLTEHWQGNFAELSNAAEAPTDILASPSGGGVIRG